MRLRKLYLLTALVTFCLGLAVFTGLRRVEQRVKVSQIERPPLSMPTNDRLEENAVYRAIIEDRLRTDSAQLLVVYSQATRHVNYEDEIKDYPPNDLFFALRKEMSIEWETAYSYFVKNQVPSEIMLGDIGRPYHLISQNVHDEIFSNSERLVGSTGSFTFSRVGLNSKRDQAFVYSSWSCGSLCGEGGYYVLSKRGSSWEIKDKGAFWVS